MNEDNAPHVFDAYTFVTFAQSLTLNTYKIFITTAKAQAQYFISGDFLYNVKHFFQNTVNVSTHTLAFFLLLYVTYKLRLINFLMFL